MKYEATRQGRPLCKLCKRYPRGYKSPSTGKFRVDDDHECCARCYRAMLDANRAERLKTKGVETHELLGT